MNGKDASLSRSCFIPIQFIPTKAGKIPSTALYLLLYLATTIMSDKKNFKITAEGSLGLLALGDIGLNLWREQRKKEGKDPYDKLDKKEKTDGKETGK